MLPLVYCLMPHRYKKLSFLELLVMAEVIGGWNTESFGHIVSTGIQTIICRQKWTVMEVLIAGPQGSVRQTFFMIS